MWMQVGVLALALVAIQGKGIAQHNSVLKSSPKCCVPPNYQMNVWEEVGFFDSATKTPGLLQYFLMYARNSDTQTIGYYILDPLAGFAMVSHQIQDFKEHKQYTIVKDKCVVESLPKQWDPQCLPESSKLLAPYQMGLGEDSLKINAWMIPFQGTNMTLSITENCIPTSASFNAQDKTVSMHITLGYSNMSLKYKNPEILVVPDICKKAPLTDFDGEAPIKIHLPF